MKKILFPPLFVEKLSGTWKTFIYEKFSLIKTRKKPKINQMQPPETEPFDTLSYSSLVIGI